MDAGSKIFSEYNLKCELDSDIINCMSAWRNTPPDDELPSCVMPNFSVDSLIGLIDGLQYIHNQSYIHRDLKLDNIMFTYSGEYKICDFSSLRKCTTTDTLLRSSSIHVAPELEYDSCFRSTDFPYAVDVYAMGFIIYQLLNHEMIELRTQFIIEARNEFLEGDYRKITNPDVPDHNDYFPGWKQLVVKMTEKDPSVRLSVAQVGKALVGMRDTVQRKGKYLGDDCYDRLYADVFWFDSKYDPKRT